MSNYGNKMGGRMEGNRVFVSNLDYTASFQEIRDIFTPYAEVAFVEIVKDNDGRPSGTAIVRFKDSNKAKEVIEATFGNEFKGRKLIVREDNGGGNRHKILVGNLPFTSTIDDIKQLFNTVGDVGFVDVQRDDKKRPNGNAIVRYKESDGAQRAISELNGVDLNGRKLNIKEYNESYDKGQNFSRGGGGGGGQKQSSVSAFESRSPFVSNQSPFNHPNEGMGPNAYSALASSLGNFPNAGGNIGNMSRGMGGGGSFGMGGGGSSNMMGMGGGAMAPPPSASNMPSSWASGYGSSMGTGNISSSPWDNADPDMGDRKRKFPSDFGDNKEKYGNTYGLTPEFLESLGIDGPIVSRIFVANLNYNVSEENLRDLFSLAGTVTEVDLVKNDDGKSKGFGFVEFEHPLEAVQAISALNDQSYFERKINVRLDRKHKRKKETTKLPEGLKSIGLGLGRQGEIMKIQD